VPLLTVHVRSDGFGLVQVNVGVPLAALRLVPLFSSPPATSRGASHGARQLAGFGNEGVGGNMDVLHRKGFAVCPTLGTPESQPGVP
jgi:hypothetical protein